jgi:hypothetical protein
VVAALEANDVLDSHTPRRAIKQAERNSPIAYATIFVARTGSFASSVEPRLVAEIRADPEYNQITPNHYQRSGTLAPKVRPISFPVNGLSYSYLPFGQLSVQAFALSDDSAALRPVRPARPLVCSRIRLAEMRSGVARPSVNRP